MTFDIGRVMSATFAVIARHPVVFLGLSLIVAGLPYGLTQYFALSPDLWMSVFSEELIASSGLENAWVGWILGGTTIFIFYFILMVLLQAMLIVATIRDMRSQDVDIGLCFAEALRRFLPLIGLALVSLLGIILGFMLLIVPGVILSLMWMIAAPVMVVEDRGIIDSLGRSVELTDGSKGMMFLLVIIFLLASGTLSGMAEALGLFSVTASVLITIIAETAIAAVQAAGIAAVYIELRTVKEGPLTDALEDIFA